ncbi:MAG: hypothetical protein ACQEXJ_06435, partial [Myxococcota bacterium]
MMSSRFLVIVAVGWAALATVWGCDEEGRRVLPTCSEDTPCETGICYLATGKCLDPQGDPDGDGLINSVEIGLGTDPFDEDTDGDGMTDAEEVGDPSNPSDSDEDGLHDALEHAEQDADEDCIADQFDPEDGVDMEARVEEACPLEGVCAAQRDSLSARCEPAEGPGDDPVWLCVLGDVPGYTEGVDDACDGQDNDCDGETDEDFAGEATTCGTAPCVAEGEITCVDGELVDTCTPGQGAEADATCDGVDDDCDGSTDEDYAPVDTTCGTGACASGG